MGTKRNANTDGMRTDTVCSYGTMGSCDGEEIAGRARNDGEGEKDAGLLRRLAMTSPALCKGGFAIPPRYSPLMEGNEGKRRWERKDSSGEALRMTNGG